MIEATITIIKSEQLLRFQRAVWKLGKMIDQPQSARQANNLQADADDTADMGLMEASFERWLWEGVRIMNEYVNGTPHYRNTQNETDYFDIVLHMPANWGTHSAPGLKYALLELVHNGMMGDWLDDMKPDQATAYKKKAEVNKAEIQSIVYSLNAPS